MKAKKLRAMSDQELGDTLKEVQRQLFDLRFQSATDRLETPSEIRNARRDVARLLTVRRERELAALAKQS